MNEDVPICHCAEYYGSHAPDCPIAAEVRALRARVAERDDQIAAMNREAVAWAARTEKKLDAALSARSGEDGA